MAGSFPAGSSGLGAQQMTEASAGSNSFRDGLNEGCRDSLTVCFGDPRGPWQRGSNENAMRPAGICKGGVSSPEISGFQPMAYFPQRSRMIAAYPRDCALG